MQQATADGEILGRRPHHSVEEHQSIYWKNSPLPYLIVPRRAATALFGEKVSSPADWQGEMEDALGQICLQEFPQLKR
jgi:hypothetical protein